MSSNLSSEHLICIDKKKRRKEQNTVFDLGAHVFFSCELNRITQKVNLYGTRHRNLIV